jgi:peptidoglycan/LPS O-acetylase OafA/YrhL
MLFEARVAFVMFFVLSGYLLYRPFARAALGESQPVSVRAYVVRRAARIMPAYYLAIVGALALIAAAGAAPGRRMVDADQLPLFLVFAQNYTPGTLLKLNAATWTLAVEVAFYVMLPLIGLLALRRGRRKARAQVVLLSTLIFAGIAWNLLDFALGWGPVERHSPPSFLPYFACGMLVALIVERRHARQRPLLGVKATALLTGGALALLLLNGFWHASERSPDGFLIETIADLPAAVAFAAIIAAMVVGTGAGVGWVGWKPFSWFGQISYGFYLWHIPVLVWARGNGLLDGGVHLDVAFVLPVAVCLGAASWYLVEQPLMRRAARWQRVAAPERAVDDLQRSQARTIAFANPRP